MDAKIWFIPTSANIANRSTNNQFLNVKLFLTLTIINIINYAICKRPKPISGETTFSQEKPVYSDIRRNCLGRVAQLLVYLGERNLSTCQLINGSSFSKKCKQMKCILKNMRQAIFQLFGVLSSSISQFLSILCFLKSILLKVNSTSLKLQNFSHQYFSNSWYNQRRQIHMLANII